MTYCLAMRLDEGLVFLSDTRTNAGVDNVSTYRKLFVFHPTPDRTFVIQSAGNLATTQEVIDRIDRDLADPGASESLATARAPLRSGAVPRPAQRSRSPASTAPRSPPSGADGTSTFILGGQIGDEPPDILLVYPEGNYIRASDDRPFLQIGETKYGKFLLELATAGPPAHRERGQGGAELDGQHRRTPTSRSGRPTTSASTARHPPAPARPHRRGLALPRPPQRGVDAAPGPRSTSSRWSSRATSRWSEPGPSAGERLAGELGQAGEPGLGVVGQTCRGGPHRGVVALRRIDARRVEGAAVGPRGDVGLGAERARPPAVPRTCIRAQLGGLSR